jgi:protein gp37
VRSIRDQCAETDTPFFFKQWGAWIPSAIVDNYDIKHSDVDMIDQEIFLKVGKKYAGRTLDNREYKEFPKVKEVENG